MVTRAAPHPPTPIWKETKGILSSTSGKKNIQTLEKTFTCLSKSSKAFRKKKFRTDGKSISKIFSGGEKPPSYEPKRQTEEIKLFVSVQPCQQHFKVTEEEEPLTRKRLWCLSSVFFYATSFTSTGSAVCQPSAPRPLWQDSQSCDTPDVPSPHYADVKPSPRQSHALLTANSPSHHDFKHLALIELFIVLSVSFKLFCVVWNLQRNEPQTCRDASEATRAVLFLPRRRPTQTVRFDGWTLSASSFYCPPSVTFQHCLKLESVTFFIFGILSFYLKSLCVFYFCINPPDSLHVEQLSCVQPITYSIISRCMRQY